MPPPTHFEVAISAVERLVKEEQSYHREIQQQTDKIRQLEHEKSDDENREYLLNQERLALEETKKVLPNLRQKIDEAVVKLEKVLMEEGKRGHESNVRHITHAKEAIAKAKTAKREIA